MRQRIRVARQNESGFTLIELLIVIVILGVLAGIVVFAVSAFNNDGVEVACRADKKNVEIASEAYYAKKGTYASGITGTGTPVTTLVESGYLKQAPPAAGATGAKYTIAYTPATTSGAPDYTKAPAITGTLVSATGTC